MPAPRGTAPIRARSDTAPLGAAPQQVPRHRTKAPDAVRVAIGAAAAEEEEEEEHEPIGIPGLRPPTGLFLAPDAGMRVIEPPSLSWDPIANVRLYRLRLFRGTREVFEVATVEPSVSLPVAGDMTVSDRRCSRVCTGGRSDPFRRCGRTMTGGSGFSSRAPSSSSWARPHSA